MVRAGDFLCTDDLDSGYWHVKIHPSHRKFLGIHIEDEDKKPIFFLWNVLFLGVADAVFIFTALLKPVRAFIASLGIRCLIYLDDILTLGPSFEAAQRNRDRAVEVLTKTGFIISQDKSQGPCSRLKYPEPRRVQLRALASFLGFIQSCSIALGPVVRMRTRVCYH